MPGGLPANPPRLPLDKSRKIFYNIIEFVASATVSPATNLLQIDLSVRRLRSCRWRPFAERNSIMPTIMRQINVISRCEGIYRTDRMRGPELGACHHSYILAICRHPGISQEELARHICINKSSVTRHLSHLEEHGYVERRQTTAEKRVTLVYPTQKMLGALPEVRRIVREWNEYLTEELTEAELEQFRSVLERLSARARKYIDRKDEAEA